MDVEFIYKDSIDMLMNITYVSDIHYLYVQWQLFCLGIISH
jgi:hypothetical protein